MKIKDAVQIAGPLGYPSKMPGTSYGISAKACITGSKLALIPGSTCFGCYALKGNYIYPSVTMSHEKRLVGLEHPQWTTAMVVQLRAAHAPKRKRDKRGRFVKRIADLPPFHRWHDSGDLQSTEHLTKIAAVAALTPELSHWLPTRELSLVKAYVAKGGMVPDNLTIRVSATMVDGPATKAWPITSGVHDVMLTDGMICPAPTQGNACGSCRMCWNKDIAHTSYHKH